MTRGNAFRNLVLIGVTPLQQPHGRDNRKQPRQFGHLRHIALPEKDRLLGIEPAGQKIQCHIKRIFSQLIWITHAR